MSPGPVAPQQQSQQEPQTLPTGQPGTPENRAPRIEQDEDAQFERELQTSALNDGTLTVPNGPASTESNFDERKETSAPSADEQTAPGVTEPAQPIPIEARTNSMETNPTYIDLQNPMPDEFAPDETEIEAATAAYRAAEKKKRAARKRELAAGRPTREELDRSAQLVRFPLDSARVAFASLAESTRQSSPSAPPPDLARHSRRCMVCSHPDRDAIEAEFIRWRSPIRIAEEYGIADRTSIYRHAQATGLMHRRRREASRVLEHVLERAESTPTEEFDVITRALRLYTHLDDDARFREPIRTHHVLHGQIAPPAANAIDVIPPGAPDASLPE
ncbi:MAG TPA: hypothetical protein VFW94_04505 [Candidatus Acidoferrales bacterium]|nr:hypothetical protein [Candidatus Acidoferrales bacterium]